MYFAISTFVLTFSAGSLPALPSPVAPELPAAAPTLLEATPCLANASRADTAWQPSGWYNPASLDSPLSLRRPLLEIVRFDAAMSTVRLVAPESRSMCKASLARR